MDQTRKRVNAPGAENLDKKATPRELAEENAPKPGRQPDKGG